MRRIIVLTIAAALITAACSGSTSSTSTSSTWGEAPGTTRPPTGEGTIAAVAGRFEPGDIRFVAALERLDSCDAVLDYFQTEALSRVGPYGLGGGPGYPLPLDGDVVFAEPLAGEAGGPVTTAAAADLAPSGGGDDFSGTNVQVAGVDEPDIVKTDGSRILTILDGVLSYVDAAREEPDLLDRLRLEGGWNHSILVSGDRAFVFSGGSGHLGIPEPLLAADIAPHPWYDGEVTLIQEIDLSDPYAMEIVRTLRIEGRFLSARAIGDTVRVVVNSYPRDLPFVYPSGPSAEDFAEEANREVVRRSTIDDWVPSYALFDGDDMVAEGLLVECSRMHRPAEFAGFDTLSVLTLDLGSTLSSGEGSAVIAQGETVYASAESLYVATNVWIPDVLIGTPELADLEEEYETAIHQFDISGDGAAVYLASGSIDGHLLNQFSMDEHDGVLRVATTDGPPWGFAEESESAVVTLRRDGDRLEKAGRVGDLGRGERIYAVRFVGETGYVVTFRQTDPLYVIDLGDPDMPAVAGELKIPGYSAYLHPLGGGMLLGVGRDATDEGRVIGAKVSLFDVTNPGEPVEVDTWSLPDGSTEVEWDHHAFLYWGPEQIAVLPMQSWEDDFYGAVVLRVDRDLEEIGRITHRAGYGVDPRCRPVDIPDEFGDEEIVVQVCEDDEVGGLDGYWCQVVPADDLAYVIDEAPFDIDVGDEERLEVCWPDDGPTAPPIVRSLVVGDVLWTLSWQWLQGNALDNFEVLHRIPIG